MLLITSALLTHALLFLQPVNQLFLGEALFDQTQPHSMGPNHIGPFEVLYQACQFIPLTHKLWDGRKTPTWTQQYETLENVDTSTFVPLWTNSNRENTWRSSPWWLHTQSHTSIPAFQPYRAVIITFHSAKSWTERVSLALRCWPYWLNTMQLYKCRYIKAKL